MYTYNVFLAAITISFDQLIYFVNENNGTVELKAILSNPSTTDITVQIISSDVTAISKYAHYYNLLYVNICIIICTASHIVSYYILPYMCTPATSMLHTYTNVHYK